MATVRIRYLDNQTAGSVLHLLKDIKIAKPNSQRLMNSPSTVSDISVDERKTNCFPCPALNAGTIGQMFTLNIARYNVYRQCAAPPPDAVHKSPNHLWKNAGFRHGCNSAFNCKNAVSSRRVFSTYANTSPVAWSTACHNQRCCFDWTKLHISRKLCLGSYNS